MSSAHYFWQICTLLLVVLDTVLIPLTLAWPDARQETALAIYFQVCSVLSSSPETASPQQFATSCDNDLEHKHSNV